MYIVPIAWLYVAVMMAVVEANSSTGTVLGALITFVFYGLLPVAILVYVMGTPSRRRAIKAKEAAEREAARSAQPDAGGHAAGDAVAAVRKEP